MQRTHCSKGDRVFPRYRDELIVSELPGEALVYDFATHGAHCMNDLSHRVFRRCDGKTSVDAIVEQLSTELGAPLDEAHVWDALAQLSKAGLLVDAVKPPVDFSRRRALRGLTLTAGLSVALPMVWSIVAPSVAEAASVACLAGLGACMGSTSTACYGTSGQPATACTSFGIPSCSGNTCR